MHGIRRDTEIRSMSGRYASYWNAFLFILNYASKNDFGKKSLSPVDTFCPEMSIVSLIKESCP